MIDPLEAALIIEERTKARLASRKKKVVFVLGVSDEKGHDSTTAG